MSGTALLNRFDDLRATFPPATASSSKKRVSTGKTNISRSATNSSHAAADGDEARRPKTTAMSRPIVDVRTGSESRLLPPKTAGSSKRIPSRGTSLSSREEKGAAEKLSHNEGPDWNASKTGIAVIEGGNPQQRLQLGSPAEKPAERVVQAFKRDTSLVKFVDEVRKADTRCEGALEESQLKAVTESMVMNANAAEISNLFEACDPVKTPRTGRRVVQISSLARFIWPQAQRPALQQRKTLSKQPKHLFGLRAAGLLNDTRESSLREIGEIGPLHNLNANFSSSVLDPVNWQPARLKHGPWQGERPLLRMEARDPTEVHAEDGWEATAAMIANGEGKFKTGLRLSAVSDFLTHPRHFNLITCKTPDVTRHGPAHQPSADFRPFRVNGHSSLAPTDVGQMRGARMAGDNKPPTAPDASERTLNPEATYSMQDAMSGTLARSMEPDTKFATNKIMPSIRSLRLFHPAEAYRTSKLDVSDILGASPGPAYVASSLRGSISQPLLLSLTQHSQPRVLPRVVSAGEECPAAFEHLLPVRNTAFSAMQAGGCFTNSLRPGKHVW